MKTALKVAGGLLLVLLVVAAVRIGPIVYRLYVGLNVYETVPPELPADLSEPAILVFSKTNGFRHEEAIPAALEAIGEIGARRGWSIFATDNGAVFNPAQLSRFRATVWNNTSGDTLTAEQKAAFRSYIEGGGGFVGIHGAGGDFRYKWKWYVNHLIGVQFTGHTMSPQFQETTVYVNDREHPATSHLPPEWRRTDEWYAFDASPRTKGVRVLATIDESEYNPDSFFGEGMGDDHPILWCHCVGQGRAFYSAMGHNAADYREPQYVGLLEGAIAWAAGLGEDECAYPIVGTED